VAIAGATAAALGGFVARIAFRHAPPEKTAEITGWINRFDDIRRRLLDLVTEDADACAAALRGSRPENNSPPSRPDILAPPFEIAGCGVAVLELCYRLFPCHYPPTRADLAVAAELARACAEGALRIVVESLPEGSHSERLEALRRDTEDLSRKIEKQMRS